MKHKIMECIFFTCEFALFFLILYLRLLLLESTTSNEFLHCISETTSVNLSYIVFTPDDNSYSTILQSSIHNLRFDTPSTPKPLAIITPLSYSHVQSTVLCSVKFGLNIRTRSGGHDYEGLSYTSFDHTPFVVLDLNPLRSVSVDSQANTAWVESGATLGEVYYYVTQKSNNSLGFPAGECTSVGVGGHISGGGFGMMARKYGLASDNVIDALVVDVNGRILDRDSMGEDLFWAIRGGGGASFGIVLSWKINLVYVPPVVTVFSLSKTLDEDAIGLVYKWQHVAPNITEDLFISLLITPVYSTMQVTFNSLFLGTADKLMKIVSDVFPELGLQEKDCIEMSWIESTVYYSFYLRGQSIDTLIERPTMQKSYFKIKSDYVKQPIPEEALREIMILCLQENMNLEIEPHGGKMSEIDEMATPYPHREGNLYIIQYIMKWVEEEINATKNNVASMRKIYDKMSPYVSKNPREAYVNFRDLDLGTSCNACSTSYQQASRWGKSYFKGNFKRLAKVKGVVDPTNFFHNEQSIPPLLLSQSY